MKKLLFLMFTVLWAATNSFGQCTTNITLSSQNDVDDFPVNYACTTINGNLTVDGSNITDLTTLLNITTINGILTVKNTSLSSINLTNLGVLNDLIIETNPLLQTVNINSITALNSFYISGNPNLVWCNLNGLVSLGNSSTNLTSSQFLSNGINVAIGQKNGIACHSLKNIYGGITFQGNRIANSGTIASPTEGIDFPELENIIGELNIIDNILTVSIFLPKLSFVSSLRIEDNKGFEIIDLNALTTVGLGGIKIYNNNHLMFVLMENLMTVNGNFEVGLNVWLQKLNDNSTTGLIPSLTKLSTVSGELFIHDNPQLNSISGFKTLTQLGSLNITNNKILSICNEIGICNFLATSNVNAIISYNKSGCNSVPEVKMACLNGGSIYFTGKVFLENTSYKYDPTTGTNNPKMLPYFPSNLLLPNSDPYPSMNVGGNSFPYLSVNHVPKVMNNAGAGYYNKLVDWIVIYLRTGTPGSLTTVYSTAAHLLDDGSIVDIDGISPVCITAPAGNYYIAIKHRNHLGIRTEDAYSLSANQVTYLDFSSDPINGPVKLNGQYNTTPIVPGSYSYQYKLIAGDANYDGSVDAFDTILWEQQNGSFDIYGNNADYNLDGSIDAFDTIIWEINFGKYEDLD